MNAAKRLERLRALQAQLRLAASLPDDYDLPVGSLYLYALACAYLGTTSDSSAHERKLAELFHEQAEEEGVEGDLILTALTDVGQKAAEAVS